MNESVSPAVGVRKSSQPVTAWPVSIGAFMLASTSDTLSFENHFTGSSGVKSAGKYRMGFPPSISQYLQPRAMLGVPRLVTDTSNKISFLFGSLVLLNITRLTSGTRAGAFKLGASIGSVICKTVWSVEHGVG